MKGDTSSLDYGSGSFARFPMCARTPLFSPGRRQRFRCVIPKGVPVSLSACW